MTEFSTLQMCAYVDCWLLRSHGLQFFARDFLTMVSKLVPFPRDLSYRNLIRPNNFSPSFPV